MIIAVDFDGTIVEDAFPNIGKPRPFAFETLKRLQTEGHHQLILWTSREGQYKQEAIDYCASKGIDFYAVNMNYPEEGDRKDGSRKIVADLYIDDRQLGGLPDWGVIYQMIMTGKYKKPIASVELPTEKKRKKLFGLFG